MYGKMKEILRKVYFKPIRAVFKPILNGVDGISSLNIWAVATVRYGAGIINWNKEELDRLDRKTRKFITMHGGLHRCLNVDKLYIPRTENGRALMIVRDCVELERSNLLLHAVNSDKKLLKAASEELQLKARIEKKKKEQRKKERLDN